MAAAENSDGYTDTSVMGTRLQADTVHLLFDEGETETDATFQNGEEVSSVEISGQERIAGFSARSGVTFLDMVFECVNRTEESFPECYDAVNSAEANFQISLANAVLNIQYMFFVNLADSINGAIYYVFDETERYFKEFDKDLDEIRTNGMYSLWIFQRWDGYFAIESDTETYRGSEGIWTRTIKRGLNNLDRGYYKINEMNEVMKAFKVGDSAGSNTNSDGQFVKMFKLATYSPLALMYSDQYAYNDFMKRYLSISDEYYETREGESKFIKLLKNGLKNIKNIYDWNNTKLKVDWLKSEDNTSEGIWARLFKAQWRDIESIKSYAKTIASNSGSTGGGGGASAESIFDAFEDSLDDFQSSLDKMVKYLKNFEVTNEAGTNFWDVPNTLVGTIDGVLEFLDNFMDFFVEVFVPKENVIDKGFKDLQGIMNTKFKSMSALKSTIESTYNQPQKEFETINVTLPAYGSVKILDGTFLNQALPVTRNLIGGAMLLFTTIWAYRKITTELIT